ncbi:Phloem protein 2-like protein [Dioscorea alata]|uniref:Phloem protein 2-like protein n=1 Tax=Dioscorea alata TaxID=55571 RepID=A0ACB7VWV9_DIOAL|nr:Phloem protein 2-like protein [Dioscorea alata]
MLNMCIKAEGRFMSLTRKSLKFSSKMSHHVKPHKHWDSFGEHKICTSTKGLDIIWGNDERFWKQVQIPKDGACLNYGEGMELIQVCWLEVRGILNLEETQHLATNKTYELFYIIKFEVDAFGWDDGPVSLHLVTPDGRKSKRSHNFGEYKRNEWHKVSGGEFTVGSTIKGNVRYGMYETETLWWKGGMVLHGVLIEPKK